MTTPLRCLDRGAGGIAQAGLRPSPAPSSERDRTAHQRGTTMTRRTHTPSPPVPTAVTGRGAPPPGPDATDPDRTGRAVADAGARATVRAPGYATSAYPTAIATVTR